MKRVMIAGLIGISLFSLVGCNESSKEVIIEEGNRKEEIVLEQIENKGDGLYYLESYLNGEYYLSKYIEEEEITEKELYKLNKNNTFEKTNKELLHARYTDRAIYIMENEKDSPSSKVRYVNMKTHEEKVGNFNFGDEVIESINLVYGKEKIAYTNQKNTGNKSILKIVDIEKNTLKEVDYAFEGNIRAMIYVDSYYVLDDTGFKLYKLKEEEGSFKVEETIDLVKEFNVKVHDDIFYVGRVFLKENGELYLEGNDNNRNIKHTNSCGQALFKYNLKTKEKARIDYDLNKEMVISDYNLKSGYIMLKSMKDFDKETANEKVYIGRVSNDKVEIIEEIDIKSDGAFIIGVETMFNEDGTGALISYARVKDNQRLNEYLKVTIK